MHETGAEEDIAAATAEARQRTLDRARYLAATYPDAWAQAEKQLKARLRGKNENEQKAALVSRTLDILAGETEESNIAKAKEASLTGKPPSVKNKGRNKTGKQVKPHFDYPAPDTESELDAIQERVAELARVAHTIASLGVSGVDAAPVVMAGLHEVSKRAEHLARGLGLSAISEGKMSQAHAGRLLDVHQATVSRWIVEATQERQDQ